MFPSINSLQGTIRCNRTELIEAGAIVWLGGRLLINPPVFDLTLLDIGRRRAEQYQHRLQDLTGQVEQLTAAGCMKVYREQVLGASTAPRFELRAMIDFVRDGDTVVVTKLDRLARSMVDFWNIWERLQAKSVILRVLNMDGLDTSTSTGQLIMGVLSSVAQFERRQRLVRLGYLLIDRPLPLGRCLPV